MKKALVILGPTSTGKTDLGLMLAKKFNGELVACDSRQVYIGLDIGTGKLPGDKVEVKKNRGYWELNGVKTWMYDIADPKLQYTVKDYVENALEIVDDISTRNKLPVVVGGSGLYLKALVEGLSNLYNGFDQKLRTELLSLTREQLQSKLKEISLEKWNSLNNSDKENPRRLIRAIELSRTKQNSKEEVKSLKKLGYSTISIGLSAPRDILNQRIDKRVIKRVELGMIEEARILHKKGLSLDRMKKLGLEYGLLAELISGKIDKKKFIEVLKIKIHQFAKRQMTWFKNNPDIFWFDVSKKDWLQKVENLTAAWYNRS